MPMNFEWDENKARTNLQKHGVSFGTAIRVFKDENRIEIFDKNHSLDEERYITIGAADKILYVVYTERTETIRIISARLATARERSWYYGEDYIG